MENGREWAADDWGGEGGEGNEGHASSKFLVYLCIASEPANFRTISVSRWVVSWLLSSPGNSSVDSADLVDSVDSVDYGCYHKVSDPDDD